jgi:GH24 family phage-related lysozyme (muramidase)
VSCNLFASSKKRGIKPIIDGSIDTLQTAIKPVTHVIRKVKTLSSIAGKYENITYQEIAQANGISNPNNIYVGQRLKIPNQTSVPQQPSKPKHKSISDDTSIGGGKKDGCEKCERKNKPWSISSKGVAFLKNYEVLKLKMYNDSANHATIGYGHLIHHGPISGKKSEIPFENGISEIEATELLKKDLMRYEAAVNKYVSVSLCQQEYDALVIFCFNIGIGGFKKSSALRVLNKQQYNMVGNKMKLFNKAGGKVSKGLVNRRAEEVEIFEKGDYVRTR